MADSARARLWLYLDVLLVAIGFWLVGPVPVALIGAPYDAGLFVRLANFLLAGQWLGPFDALTLAKGPFYPLFLAGCAAVSVPIQLGIEAVYLTGAVLMARVLARLSGRAWAGSLCLALLVFNPACTDWSVGALMREPLYCALSLLVMALAARVFLCGGGVWWGVALGGAFAAFWLTREEGVLLVPSLLMMAAWYVRGVVVRGWSRALPVTTVLPPVTALAAALGLILAICAINQDYYGVFRSNDFQSGAFGRGYGALSRILPHQWQRLTPITRDMRLAAYAVSPAARELQPVLDGPNPLFAVDVLCEETGRPACHDIPGASFMWALREAVTHAGYYGSARRADGFYKRLAREIDAACEAGALHCLGARRGFAPPLRLRDAWPVLGSLGHVAWDMLLLGRAGPLVMPSTADGPEALAYASVTQGSAISPQARFMGAPAWQITGALSSPDPAMSLSVAGPPGTSVAADIGVTLAPAANASLHRASGVAEVFSADVRCAPGNCRLEVGGEGARLGSWPVAGLRTGVILDVPQAALYIDAVGHVPSFSRTGSSPLRWAVMRAASRVLDTVSVVAVPAALVWLVVCAVRRPRPPGAPFVLASGLLVAVLLRMALLALLDATTIERQFRYESPAIGLLLVLLASAASMRAETPNAKKVSLDH